MPTKDQDVWRTYTSKLARVPKKKRSPPPCGKGQGEGSSANTAFAIYEPPSQMLFHSKQERIPFAPLERKREKSFRDGTFEIEAKLDLHGMTQVEAFNALAAFMQRKAKAGKRNLLIVTGKGRGGAGVLRNNLENWLAQLPEGRFVLALRQASIKHGGEGAFYVVLSKRVRS